MIYLVSSPKHVFAYRNITDMLGTILTGSYKTKILLKSGQQGNILSNSKPHGATPVSSLNTLFMLMHWKAFSQSFTVPQMADLD